MWCYPVFHAVGESPPPALNFDLKFALDCTRCLWNNYHSVQAQITLLDLIFIIMMTWRKRHVRKTKYINITSNCSSHIYFLQSDYNTVICVANSHCLQNVRRPKIGSEFSSMTALSPAKFVFYKSQPLRGKWRTNILSPVFCVRNVYKWDPWSYCC